MFCCSVGRLGGGALDGVLLLSGKVFSVWRYGSCVCRCGGVLSDGGGDLTGSFGGVVG